MFDKDEYFRGLSFGKVVLLVLLFFGAIVLSSQVRGESPSVKESIEKESLEINTAEMGWPTQIVYDSVNACYQGTYRWIVMSNPSLIGITPPPQTQRAMVEHCFCVLDRVRKDYKFTDYLQITPNQQMVGDLYYQTALKCVIENGTLQGIIYLEAKDNETNSDNTTIVPDKPEKKDTSKEESLPDQPKEEESNGLPDTLFQG
tara:strand:+ start:2419 stop:3024 length:606 start_codon:yes stop_codon:yes gene_type:complete